jgi:hypothetical protein
MKYVVRVVQLAVLAAVLVWLWTIFFPSPEKVIRKQLTRLAADVSFSKSDGSLTKLAGLAEASDVAGFFSTNVEFNLDIPGHVLPAITGRDEITQAALLARQQTSNLSVKFPDINVTLAPDKQSATADVTVEVNAAGASDDFIHELKISFEKSNRLWLIQKIETIRAISQPALK